VSERGTIVLYESIFAGQRLQAMKRGEDVPWLRGVCCWCGEPIVLVDPERDFRRRSRTRHYGDEYEVGDRDCRRAFLNSYVFNERQLIELRGDPDCVDCGSTGPWEADHDLALWEGGEHSSANIVRRCVPCHRTKTAEEAARRAAQRREERGLPEPLPAHHPGQASLAVAA
jgi:5-methylcytosine-specific restriction endonuclease McrA